MKTGKEVFEEILEAQTKANEAIEKVRLFCKENGISDGIIRHNADDQITERKAVEILEKYGAYSPSFSVMNIYRTKKQGDFSQFSPEYLKSNGIHKAKCELGIVSIKKKDVCEIRTSADLSWYGFTVPFKYLTGIEIAPEELEKRVIRNFDNGNKIIHLTLIEGETLTKTLESR